MTGRFRRTRSGFAVRLAAGESAVLAHLCRELLALLDAGDPSGGAPRDPLEQLTGLVDGPVSAPDDPVLRRLLPDAYSDDAKGAEDFRRHTELDLRAGKRDNARLLLDSLPAAGGTTVVDEAGALAWLTALTDMRLLLGVRLGVEEDTGEQLRRLRPEDPRRPGLEVYAWLSYVQDTLIQALGDPTKGAR